MIGNTQTNVRCVYRDFPTSKEKPHRLHPAIAALIWEYQVALSEKRVPKYELITTKHISKRIDIAIRKYPLWPTILKADDLSSRAYEKAEFVWWVPKSDDVDADGDTAMTRKGEVERGADDVVEEHAEDKNAEDEYVDEEEEEEDDEEHKPGAHNDVYSYLRIITVFRTHASSLAADDQRTGTSAAR